MTSPKEYGKGRQADTEVTAPLGLDAPSEAFLFDVLNGCQDGFRQLMQRWNNRLTFKDLVFPEKYLEERFSFVLYDEGAGNSMHYVQVSATPNAKRASFHGNRAKLERNIPQFRNSKCGNQELVLIEDIHGVQGPQNSIPSLVGFYYVDNDCDKIDASNLYWSPINGCYKFLPAFSEGKVNVVGKFPGYLEYDLGGNEVEGRSQVMQRIAQDEGDFLKGWRGEFVLNGLCFGVYCKGSGIDALFNGVIKFSNVLIGPFDF